MLSDTTTSPKESQKDVIEYLSSPQLSSQIVLNGSVESAYNISCIAEALKLSFEEFAVPNAGDTHIPGFAKLDELIGDSRWKPAHPSFILSKLETLNLVTSTDEAQAPEVPEAAPPPDNMHRALDVFIPKLKIFIKKAEAEKSERLKNEVKEKKEKELQREETRKNKFFGYFSGENQLQEVDISLGFSIKEIVEALQKSFEKESVSQTEAPYIGVWRDLHKNRHFYLTLHGLFSNLENLHSIPNSITGAPEKQMRQALGNFLEKFYALLTFACKKTRESKEDIQSSCAIIYEYMKDIKYIDSLAGAVATDRRPSVADVNFNRCIAWMEWTIAEQPRQVREIILDYLGGDLRGLASRYSFDEKLTPFPTNLKSAQVSYDLQQILAALPKQGLEKLQESLNIIQQKLPVQDAGLLDQQLPSFRQKRERPGGVLEKLKNKLSTLSLGDNSVNLDGATAVPLPSSKAAPSTYFPIHFTVADLNVVFREALEKVGVAPSVDLPYVGSSSKASKKYPQISSDLYDFICAVEELSSMPAAIPGALNACAQLAIKDFLKDLYSALEKRKEAQYDVPRWIFLLDSREKKFLFEYDLWLSKYQANLNSVSARVERAIDWVKFVCEQKKAPCLEILSAFLSRISSLYKDFKYESDKANISTNIMSSMVDSGLNAALEELPQNGADTLKEAILAIKGSLASLEKSSVHSQQIDALKATISAQHRELEKFRTAYPDADPNAKTDIERKRSFDKEESGDGERAVLLLSKTVSGSPGESGAGLADTGSTHTAKKRF